LKTPRGCNRDSEEALGGPAAVRMMSLSALGLVLLVVATQPGFLRLKVNLEENPDVPVIAN